MKNLKRALSLALATVMTMGMMVTGTGAAANYSDADAISNVAAVEVLNAIKVMEGNPDGTFGAEDIVTREQMAVIVCKMLYGDKLNVEQFEDMNKFTDTEGRWSEGYVNLAASLDIIAGVGDGKFDPTAPVTTAQAAVMLCRALGYFQNNELAVDWRLAGITQATKLGMFDDLKLNPDEGLKRDNVAQMTFNTLTNAVPVMFNDTWKIYYNDSSNLLGGVTFWYDETLAYKNFDLVYKTVTDDLGNSQTRWGIGSINANGLDDKGNIKPYGSTMADKDAIVDVENEAIAIYTKDLTDAGGKKTIKNELKGYTLTDTAVKTVNGVETTNVALLTSGTDLIANETGAGYTVKVFANKSGTITNFSVVKEELAKVVAVDVSKDTITLQTSEGNVKLDEDHDAYENLAGQVEVDDYVLAIVNNTDKVVDAYIGDTVTGVVSKYTDKGVLTVDGEDYAAAKGTFVGALTAPKDYNNTTDEATLYLDSNGYCIAVDKSADITGENVCFVAMKQAVGVWSNSYEAYVYLPDGTKGVYTIVSIDNSTKTSDIAGVTAGMYICELTDDGVALKRNTGVDSEYKVVSSSAVVNLNKDKANYVVESGNTYYMSDETKFYMYDTNKGDVSVNNVNEVINVSTGLSTIKNGVSIASGKMSVAYKTINGKNIVVAVYGEYAGSAVAASSDLVFVSSKSWGTGNSQNYEVKALFTGDTEAQTITVKGKKDIGLYSYTESNGVYSLTPAENCAYVGALDKVTGKLLFVETTQLNGLDEALVIDATNGDDPTLTSASYLDMADTAFYGYAVVDNTTDNNVLAVYVVNAINDAAVTAANTALGSDAKIADGTGTKADPFVLTLAAGVTDLDLTSGGAYDKAYKVAGTTETEVTIGSAALAAGDTFYLKDTAPTDALSNVYFKLAEANAVTTLTLSSGGTATYTFGNVVNQAIENANDLIPVGATVTVTAGTDNKTLTITFDGETSVTITPATDEKATTTFAMKDKTVTIVEADA